LKVENKLVQEMLWIVHNLWVHVSKHGKHWHAPVAVKKAALLTPLTAQVRLDCISLLKKTRQNSSGLKK